MKIVACIKQVPDTTEVRLDPVTNTLIRTGIPSIINPDDKAGLEMALKLKDEHPGSTVTVVSMGPPQAEVALREALAMGCDEAILITDRAFGGADTWATSSTIAGALRKLEFDIIIAGRQAIDGDTAQVGPQIAEHMKLPQISYCEELSFDGKNFIAKRQYEDRHHIVELPSPCMVTALREAVDPRYMTVKGIYDAYAVEKNEDGTEKDKLKIWTLKDIEDELDLSNIGLKGSPTRVKKSFTKQGKGQGVKLEGLTAEEAAQAIFDKMKEKFFI